MRGKHITALGMFTDRRNIPAYAGKTSASEAPRVASQEHPRVCGENTGSFVRPLLASGTSPRMRGKLDNTRGPGYDARNIPAYAGKREPDTDALFDIRNIPAYAGKTL